MSLAAARKMERKEGAKISATIQRWPRPETRPLSEAYGESGRYEKDQ